MSPVCHIHTAASTSSSVLRDLIEVCTRLEAGEVIEDFSAFEADLREKVSAVERELLRAGLESLDIDAPAVLIDGVVHRQVLRCEGTYRARAGEIRAERSLYRSGPGERCVCPMELRAGVVESSWTPSAAKLAAWTLAHLTPQECEEFFQRVGGMTPSRSTLDRFPKALGARWEEQRARFEESVRAVEEVPAEAVAVGLSLDGIMVPMKDGGRQEKRAAARAAGKETRGPVGFREAACGTLTFYDAEGDRVGHTRYLGRMPEAGKVTLKESLEDGLVTVVDQRPDLTVVGVADGARDNWSWMDRTLPEGAKQALDFFHAVQHLDKALASAHGEGTPKARAEFKRLRVLLRDHPKGVDKVINALAYQRRKHPRRETIARELRYFRKNRERMRYAALREEGLPIGSGVVEAANKTLVTVRMKRAGARWTLDGGQAILTLRALAKSGRFDRAWKVLGDTYRVEVEPLFTRGRRAA